MRLDHMHLRHMRMVVMAAEGKTVGQIAEVMAVTSPCVSIAIGRCEQLLGVTIFHRSPPQNRLAGVTEDGLALVDRLRAILMMADTDDETIWQTVNACKRPWLPVAQSTVVEGRAA